MNELMLVQVPGGQLASSDHFDGPSCGHFSTPSSNTLLKTYPLNDPNCALITTAAVMHKTKVSEVFSCYSFLSQSRAHSFSYFIVRTAICIKSQLSMKRRQ